MNQRFVLAIIVGVTLVCVATNCANAAEAKDSVTKILNNFEASAYAWEATLRTLATRLFWLLAGIEFAWAAIQLALKGADLSEWLSELLTQILFIGFGVALLEHSSEWAQSIVSSFQQAADAVAKDNGANGGISPANIFATGVEVAGQVIDRMSIFHPADSVGLIVAGLIVLVCFALIAAFEAIALVETYVVISAGVLFMGFSASRWTRDFAIKIMIYSVSVGAKLFVMQLIVVLCQQLTQDWLKNFGANQTDLLIMIGSAIVLLALVKTIPDMVQGLINGASLGTGGALMGAASNVWAGATQAVSAGAAVRAAGRLASEQLRDPNLHAPGDSWPERTARNLAGAAARNVGWRLSGRANILARDGTTMGAQMARDLDRRRPAPSNPGGGGGNTIQGGGPAAPNPPSQDGGGGNVRGSGPRSPQPGPSRPGPGPNNRGGKP